jgi:CelD/BcsL family acetyltransferase involved in cellulose biosynthesis
MKQTIRERHPADLTGTSVLAGEWEALAQRVDASPFLRPGWVAAWIDAFGDGELRTVEARRGGELVAILPMLRNGSRLLAPTNWHTPGFGPLAADAEARDALLERLFDEPSTCIDLNLLDSTAVCPNALAKAARKRRRLVLARTVAQSPLIDVQGDFAAYEQRLSRNRRKGLRRQRRRLEELGEVRFEVCDGRVDLDLLLERMYAVESSGWKGARGTAIASQEDTKCFYTAIARWAAGRGWLRLAFLYLDDRPIAGDYALLQRGAWYSLKAGYDEEFGSFGPGALLLRDELVHCFDDPRVARFELLGHNDSFKASWADRIVERRWVQAFGRQPRGVLGWSTAATVERARLIRRWLMKRSNGGLMFGSPLTASELAPAASELAPFLMV